MAQAALNVDRTLNDCSCAAYESELRTHEFECVT